MRKRGSHDDEINERLQQAGWDNDSIAAALKK
jgi:hypothetical protein